MGKRKNPDNDYRFGYRRLIKVMRLNGHNDIHKCGLKKPKIVQMFALKFNRIYPLKNGILAFNDLENWNTNGLYIECDDDVKQTFIGKYL